MTRIIIMLSLLSAVFCQYPRQRASPIQTNTGPQDYGQPAYEDDDYDYRPQPNDYRPQPRNNVIYKPAPVHYVNIGAELAGDYKFGYDTGKAENGQSFREETRLPDGSVQGAYGYTDETGKQHIVKYTAGKDGFKVIGSGDEKKSSLQQPQRSYSQPQVHQSAHRQTKPQQAYQPSQQVARSQPVQYSQNSYRATQAAYRPAPESQTDYALEPQSAYAPQRPSSYAPEPQSSYVPQSQSSYVPQPQTYAPKPQVYSPRSNSRGRTGSRYVPERTSSYQDAEEDYDYPDNEITEKRRAPVDTSLLNYNIGTSSNGQA